MTNASNLLSAYRFWRASPAPMPAAVALRKAREDMAAGINRYTVLSKAAKASYQNKPTDRGGRWIEHPEGAGLRFIGWSDELRQTRDRHTGWFLYPDGDPGETARGCVYQLPARDGRPIYVEAIRTGDMGEQGAALVFLASRHVGEKGEAEYVGPDHYGAHRDAAAGADEEARIYAEKEREYQEAYQAGSRAADLREEAATARQEARGLVAELRAEFRARDGRALSGGLCAAMRGAIRGKLDSAMTAMAEAGELISRWGDQDAFKEGLQ